MGPKIQKFAEGKLTNSNINELQGQMASHKIKETKIDMKVLENLKTIFGEFELVY